MEGRGFTAEEVLEGTGLTEEMIKEVLFRPDPEQYRILIHNMQRLTRDPFLGLSLGSEFKISDLGMLGYAALSSANLNKTRQLWNRYGVLSESIIHTNNEVNGDQWYSEITEFFPLGDILPFAVEEFVSQTMTMGTSLTGKPFPVVKLCLSYPEPEDLSAYKTYFNCPMYFNQPQNVVYFDVLCLKNEISLANEEVFNVCDQQCQILVDKLEGNCSLSTDIRNALVKKPGEFPTLEEMADMLKMGSRTLRRRLAKENLSYQQLRRRLAKENLSYQQILADTRRDLAIQYLEHTSLTPKEIGFLLGYNSVSNFRRAFKSWTGKRLSDYKD
jgi:AraC-like DNA-binding protein